MQNNENLNNIFVIDQSVSIIYNSIKISINTIHIKKIIQH